MASKIDSIPKKSFTIEREKPSAKKPFMKEEMENKAAVNLSPLHVFQSALIETAVIPEQIEALSPIHEIFLKLCDRVEYSVSNGIEETTIMLSQHEGEITVKKYDTAPMHFDITFSLTTQSSNLIVSHLPELSNLLHSKFHNLEFRIQHRYLDSRKSERHYDVKKNTSS